MTTPVAFPEGLFTVASFDLKRYVAQNHLAGGKTQEKELAEPRWLGRFTTGKMTPARIRAWRAFWDDMEAGRGFLAHDPAQAYPLAYPAGFGALARAGGGAFDGTGDVTALTATTIAIATLPAGFSLVRGDLVGLKQGDLYALHRIMAAAVANNAGEIALTVKPKVLTNVFTTAAIANFARPPCVMLPDRSSWSFAAQAGSRAPVSFAGIQRLI
jgi:hypothetical protein